VCDVHIEEIIN